MSLHAWACANGHLHVPRRQTCRTCGAPIEDSLALEDRVGEIVTWTVVRAPPPGVRSPNPVAFVRFEVGDESVTLLGGLTASDVAIGQPVEPVHVEELRDPTAGIVDPPAAGWTGYRFRPIGDP